MGYKRLLKKSLIPGYRLKCIVENVAIYGLVKGIKEELRETYLEDLPITSHIYNAGKHEGKKDGYVQASNEYESKFIEQANEFLNKTKDIRNQTDEYEKLLNDYDNYIHKIVQKDNLLEIEKANKSQVMITERKLEELGTEEVFDSSNKKTILVDYDKRGFIKNTAKHKNGTKYDNEGFDKFGYNKNGFDKNGLDKFGHPRKL